MMAAPLTFVTSRQRACIFAALMLVMIMASLDQSAVNTALPRMTSDLGGLAHLSWVVTAFMLGSAISMPVYGKLSDMYGRRRLLIISIAIFLLASLLCGSAQSMITLIAFRGLQGLGAGGLMTLSQIVVGDLVPPHERGRYQGLFTGAFAVSGVLGPLLGGILATELSWRWIFFVNLPLGAVALGMILYALKPAASVRNHRIDYAGAVLLSAGTISLMLMLSWGGSVVPWLSAKAAALVGAVAALLSLFVWREHYAREPIIDMSLFNDRSFSIGVVASGMMTFAMLGSLVFLPLLFQIVLGLTPTQAGLMMLPQVFAMFASAIIGGRLSSRFGRPKPFLVVGVTCEASALTILALLTHFGFGLFAFVGPISLLGLGMGIGMPNATVIVQNAVDLRILGSATATMTFIRSLGGTLGVALSGGVMAWQLAARLGQSFSTAQVRRFTDDGLHLVSLLPPVDQALVLEAYRGAIAVSFGVSSCVMACAILVCIFLPDEKLG